MYPNVTNTFSERLLLRSPPSRRHDWSARATPLPRPPLDSAMTEVFVKVFVKVAQICSKPFVKMSTSKSYRHVHVNVINYISIYIYTYKIRDIFSCIYYMHIYINLIYKHNCGTNHSCVSERHGYLFECLLLRTPLSRDGTTERRAQLHCRGLLRNPPGPRCS